VGLDDWARDSDGGEAIDQARFRCSWLLLAGASHPDPDPNPNPNSGPNPNPNQARFCWSWLELAVLWTSTDLSAETIEVADCVD
jgi:hypothetical protein